MGVSGDYPYRSIPGHLQSIWFSRTLPIQQTSKYLRNCFSGVVRRASKEVTIVDRGNGPYALKKMEGHMTQVRTIRFSRRSCDSEACVNRQAFAPKSPQHAQMALGPGVPEYIYSGNTDRSKHHHRPAGHRHWARPSRNEWDDGKRQISWRFGRQTHNPWARYDLKSLLGSLIIALDSSTPTSSYVCRQHHRTKITEWVVWLVNLISNVIVKLTFGAQILLSVMCRTVVSASFMTGIIIYLPFTQFSSRLNQVSDQQITIQWLARLKHA